MLPFLLGDGVEGVGAVTQRLDSYQGPRVQPSLGLGGWEVASPSPPRYLDLWELSQPAPSPQGLVLQMPPGPQPLDTSHWSLGLPWGLSVKAHSPTPSTLSPSPLPAGRDNKCLYGFYLMGLGGGLGAWCGCTHSVEVTVPMIRTCPKGGAGIKPC